jgi:hypothetical protein
VRWSAGCALAPLIALALLPLAAQPARANCGSEGCPLAVFGPERLHGRWTLDVGFQSIEQDQLWDGSAASDETEGVGHVTERLMDTESWVGNVGFAVTPRLQVQAVIPYLKRHHVHDLEHHPGMFTTYEWQFQGLGDASVFRPASSFQPAQPTSRKSTARNPSRPRDSGPDRPTVCSAPRSRTRFTFRFPGAVE